jgi:DNA-binding CsgD family transcriptional regulator
MMDRIGYQIEAPLSPDQVADAPIGTPFGTTKKKATPKPSRRERAATDLERRIIFNYCSIVLHARAGQLEPAALRPAPRSTTPSRLSPRMRETMNHLLKGDSEKQIASRLRLSRHTVHCYIRQIYRRYNVNSRGELFADWVRRGGPLARHR